MAKTRDNHYVPQWYQRGFLLGHLNQLHYLDLSPDTKELPDERIITMNNRNSWPTSRCFYQTDLYTTFFGEYINDEIERRLFGKIDDIGARAVKAFIGEDISEWHRHFSDFFSYIDSQKIRTPKGLDWIRKHYPRLGQVDLMLEMQAIRNLHCTLWSEGVREIVSAKNSNIKFIVTDHPVTVYNYACSPDSEHCTYPNDPSIALKGTQTLFPLNLDHCLIFTNLEYAKNPNKQNPIEKRTNAQFVRDSMVRTDVFIRSRNLNDSEVSTINVILKKRARRYIAAPKKDWLFPEINISSDWATFKKILLPPDNELYHFGGELFAKYEDGSTYYQDAFGRKRPENKFLKKTVKTAKIGRNDYCGCGSGKKYKKCCMNKKEEERSSWQVLSIRERNLVLYNGIEDILGFNKGKTWDDVRKELCNEQIIEIHELYGSLWPTDTDIFNLLPRPDKTLRALYTGLIDPRTAMLFAIGSVPYFDEILIQHPFTNPGAVNPKFSPVKSPHQYKQQMLKNILLFLYLHPFIDQGFINFFPDPCCFDLHLQRELLEMANQRKGFIKMNECEMDRLKKIYKKDFTHTLRNLPKERQRNQVCKAMPDLSSNQVEELLQYMEKQHLEDPLALLQEDVFDEGGQLTMISLAPNFEMALFIAQVTGSIILTDSETRWEELTRAQFRGDGIISLPWSHLSDIIKNQKFIFSADPHSNFCHRMDGGFGNIRKFFREVNVAVLKNKNTSNTVIVEKQKQEFLAAYEKDIKEYNKKMKYSFNGKMNFLMPKGGFVDNNTQRLLLKSGSEKHVNNVPMAIFLELWEKN